jgi:fumarate reductase subunit D
MRDLRHENLVPFIGACVETGHIGSRFVLLLNHLPNFFKRHLLVHILLKNRIHSKVFGCRFLGVCYGLTNALLATYFHEFQIPNFGFSRIFNQVGN